MKGKKMSFRPKQTTFAIEQKRNELQRQSEEYNECELRTYPFSGSDISWTDINRVEGDFIITRRGYRISPIGRRGDQADLMFTDWFAKFYDKLYSN